MAGYCPRRRFRSYRTSRHIVRDKRRTKDLFDRAVFAVAFALKSQLQKLYAICDSVTGIQNKTCRRCVSKEEGKSMDEWVSFDGNAVSIASGKYRLSASTGGEFELFSESVKIEPGKIKVKVGALARITKHPTVTSDAAPDEAMISAGDCDHTACIGLVEICCGSERVLRACIGAWGCP